MTTSQSNRRPAEEENPLGSRRIPSLDGLRAISIILVFLSHVQLSAGFPEAVKAYMNPEIGLLGVQVFFVISGFLITALLLKEERTRGAISLGAFYKRRFLRILPAFYFYIGVIWVLSQFITSLRTPLSTYLTAATFTTGLAGNWGLAVWSNPDWLLSHAWSLAVEEQFYVLWPSLLILVPPGLGRRRFIVGFIIGLAVLMRCLLPRSGLDLLFDHLFLTQADSIMLGCMLALLIQTNGSLMDRIFQCHPHLARPVAVGIIVVCFNLPWLHAYSGHRIHYSEVILIPSIQAMVIGYLIGSYISIRNGITYHILNYPMLQRIGVLSYSLYIWQQLFLAPKGIFPVYWWQTFPQNLVLAFACGLISCHLIEKPLLAIKSRWARL